MKVHTDNYAHPDYVGLSASKYPYKDAVCEVDLEIGLMVKALEEAGVLENTLVFITSVNGPQMDGWPDAGYTPFRGAKGTTWEGGVRVPGIAYWKDWNTLWLGSCSALLGGTRPTGREAWLAPGSTCGTERRRVLVEERTNATRSAPGEA